MTETAVDRGVDSVAAIGRVLAKALRKLGDAGQAEDACELAAEAWSLLRDANPKEAERMNGVLHQLTATKCQKGADDGADDGASKSADFDLEVRHLAPAKRHELIFETYHKLVAGQGFILINDHDPKPLYYQFSYEYPNLFTWDEIEMGPEVWRVRIGKPGEQHRPA